MITKSLGKFAFYLTGICLLLSIIGLSTSISIARASNLEAISQRGLELRAAIEKTATDLSRKPLPEVSAAMGDVVAKYVPRGMEFSEVDKLMKAAGFLISDQAQILAPGQKAKYRMYVLKEVNKNGRFLVTWGTLFVAMYPKSVNGFDSVESITATYNVEMP